MIAKATFNVTGWDNKQYSEDGSAPVLSQASVTKEFAGDLIGSSVAEVLMCVSNPADFTAGAGFVASEVLKGSLNGATGSFAFQHGGLSGPDCEETFGTIIPGSGTEELAGIRGTAIIGKDESGGHSITIEYSLPE